MRLAWRRVRGRSHGLPFRVHASHPHLLTLFIAEPRLPASTGPASSAANSAPASPYRVERDPAAPAAHAARALVSYARVDIVFRASCSSAACTQPTQRVAASPQAAVAAATPASSSGSRTWCEGFQVYLGATTGELEKVEKVEKVH